MTVTMITFDFLRKLFTWIDRRPRKRVLSNSSCDEEFCSPKKFCCDRNSRNNLIQEIVSDDESDYGDIEITAEHHYSPIGSSTRLNSTNGSFCIPKTPPTHHKFNMGHSESNRKPQAIDKANCKCPTLAKTHRLQEKTQYQQLLQNFLPHGVHVIKDQTKDSRPSPAVIDVIDLASSPSPPLKVRQTSRVQDLPSHSRWSTPLKPAPTVSQPEVITLDRKKEKPENSVAGKSTNCEIDIIVTKATPPKRVECVATNTLRDELAAKAVMRGDFIPQVAKRYKERIEERYKEAEKLMKMTCVLSKHNRLAREAALEEQLARSMRLCEAFIDEREEPEEPALPPLTNEMMREIKNALIPRPPDEVLVEGFGLRITRKDIHTLDDQKWLNDEVINYYMNLLIERGGKNNFPKVHAMNTFFYPKLTTGGHASLKRWTRKIDIFAQDLIVVPVHLNGIHWCMAIIDFRDKTIRYFDSLGASNPKCLSALRKYLKDESLDKKKEPYDTNDWKLESVNDIPQQMNGSDCGVFSCVFAEYICANRKITFTQSDMPYFRRKMVYEILKSKLL